MRTPTPEAPGSLSSSLPTLGSAVGTVVHDDRTDFRVWAPNADEIHVFGSFNGWEEPGLPMVREDNGLWSVASPEAKEGDTYKFRLTREGETTVKNDPRVRQIDPETGDGVIYRDRFDWSGDDFETPLLHDIVLYELHAGTFATEDPGRVGTFDDLIARLPYLHDLGVTAIELMPPTEFPGETSWGYNPSHPFAVEGDYGGPDALKRLIRSAHDQGIAVILDVVYNHFGPDMLELWQFDGWSENGMGGIYFYNDWRAETPWGATRPDYGRHQVRQYIRDNALMWIEEFHADGLRLDAVSYIRTTKGHDHRETVDLPEGWQLMQWINKDMKLHSPRTISIAEDLGCNDALTTWIEDGGAGFDTQWDASFSYPVKAILESPSDDARDVAALAALVLGAGKDACRRVIYSESHDEVSASMERKRLVAGVDPENPESVWAQRRALQAAALVFTSPGIPMIFQGQEFLADESFDDRAPLDWEKGKRHGGIRRAFRDLIRLRRNLDGRTRGLAGQRTEMFHRDNHGKVLAWHRWWHGGPGDSTVIIMNGSARSYDFYELRLPAAGEWKIRFNADWKGYSREFEDTELVSVEGREGEVGHPAPVGGLKLPPYGVVILSQD